MWICPNCGREFKRTNQIHSCGKAPDSIDEYILRQEKDIQAALVCLRDSIRNAIPEAEETVAVSFFKERVKEYETYKGVIRLKFNQEIPCQLISDISKWCYAIDQMG